MDKRKRVHPVLRARARDLRREQTPMERRLWWHLQRKQLGGLRFRQQHSIGRFIVDFYCPAHRLVVEIDGDSHDEQREYDEGRTAWLEAQGYEVIRVTNNEVRDHLDSVLDAIWPFAFLRTYWLKSGCKSSDQGGLSMREDIRRRVRFVTKVAWIVLAVFLVLIVAISVAAPEGLFGPMWSTFYRIATITAGIALGVAIIGGLYGLISKRRG